VDKELAQKTLVLEDRVFAASEVQQGTALDKVADRLGKLLPAAGARTVARLKAGLVLVPDSVLVDLASRTLPVHARIQLTDGKTTDTWKDPLTGKTQTGNLWYEEVVPSDTLFAAFIGTRGGFGTRPGDRAWFEQQFATRDTAQIGGNETVGHGRVWWTGEAKS
jgi:CRISPR-associated protein Cmr4